MAVSVLVEVAVVSGGEVSLLDSDERPELLVESAIETGFDADGSVGVDGAVCDVDVDLADPADLADDDER